MARMSKPLPTTVTLSDFIECWAHSMKSSNRSPKTVATYTFGVKQLVQHVGADRDPTKINRSDHETLISALQDRWRPSSIASVYRSLRAFWGFVVAHDDLRVTKDPMNGMKQPTIPEIAVKFVSDDELRAMLAGCKSRSRHNYLGHRDEAIIRLLASTGARLSKIADLTLEDVDLIEATISVMGKGRRPRVLPLDDPTLAAVKLYLTQERPRHPSKGLPWLWLARAGRLTSNGIAQALRERGKRAGITRGVHPHELRHRFVSTTLGAGFSEGDVMALTGHRSRSMLDRYGAITRAQRAHDAFRRATASGVLPRL
jgi:integrase/recombinase XerC